MARPLSIYIDTPGTGKVPEEKLEKADDEAMALPQPGIRTPLDLNKPTHARTSSYGPFGRHRATHGVLPGEQTYLADTRRPAVSLSR